MVTVGDHLMTISRQMLVVVGFGVTFTCHGSSVVGAGWALVNGRSSSATLVKVNVINNHCQ